MTSAFAAERAQERLAHELLRHAIFADILGRHLTSPEPEDLMAIAAGLALSERDWIVPQDRERSVLTRFGVALESLMISQRGDRAGDWWPGARAVPAEIGSSSYLTHAVGLAWSLARKGRSAVVLACVNGDATPEGDIREALRAARSLTAPVIFFVSSQERGTADVFAVHASVARAVERARSGRRPGVVRARRRAVEPGQIEELTLRARAAGTWSDDDERRVRSEAEATVDEAVRRAEPAVRNNGRTLAEYLWWQTPPRLAGQIEDLKRAAALKRR